MGSPERLRLLRHFTILRKSLPAATGMGSICQVLLVKHLQTDKLFPRALTEAAAAVGKATAALLREMGRRCRPSPLRRHYCWNLRHVARMLDGG